jgi:hypothetical protein
MFAGHAYFWAELSILLEKVSKRQAVNRNPRSAHVMAENHSSMSPVAAGCHRPSELTGDGLVEEGSFQLVERCKFARVEGFEAAGFGLEGIAFADEAALSGGTVFDNSPARKRSARVNFQRQLQ